MALTPQNDAAFIREVDEELRREQVAKLGRRYGVVAAIVALVVLAALGGFLYWKSHHQNRSGEAGEQLSKAIADIEAGNDAAAALALKALATSQYDGYRAAARLTDAALQLQKGDAKAAAATYGAIAADADVAEPLREAALIRQVAAEFDTLPPAQVIERLKPYAVAGSPWYGSAGEMTAIALLRLNRTADAAALFAAISKDKTVPETIRLRTSKVASGYGVEALAPAAAPDADPDAAPTKE